MARRLFIVLAAASLLVAVVSAALFVRAAVGDGTPVRITTVGEYEVATSGYRLWLLRGGKQVTQARGPLLSVISLVAAALPALALGLHRTGRLRAAVMPGACRRCGYDLRATPGRCPECGVAPASGRTT